MGLLILTSMPISAIYPSSMGFPVVGRTTRNYRHISKTSFRCLFPPDGNRSVLHDLRIFSRNKPDSEVERDEIFNSRKVSAK